MKRLAGFSLSLWLCVGMSLGIPTDADACGVKLAIRSPKIRKRVAARKRNKEKRKLVASANERVPVRAGQERVPTKAKPQRRTPLRAATTDAPTPSRNENKPPVRKEEPKRVAVAPKAKVEKRRETPPPRVAAKAKVETKREAPPAKRALPKKERVAAAAPSDRIFDRHFRFGTNSSQVRDVRRLRRIARYLQANPGASIRVVGHTDSVGDDAYNEFLSQRRAQVVADQLIGMGIESSRVSVEGRGEREPIADNETANGRAKNRRVVVELQ